MIVAYGVASGRICKAAKNQTSNFFSTIKTELEYACGATFMMGDANGDAEEIKPILGLISLDIVDLGTCARKWGRIDRQVTCKVVPKRAEEISSARQRKLPES